MPLFLYKCGVCGEMKEKIMKIDEPAPVCCELEMVKEVAAVTFQLKGAGWFKDGYGK